MRGQRFLKVTGILMIIMCAFNIIIGGLALIGSGATMTLTTQDAEMAAMSGVMGIVSIMSVLMILSGITELIAGIIGIVNCKKPEKAHVCLIWGIIVMLMSIVQAGFEVYVGGMFNIFNFALSMVIPILYVYGAVMNRHEKCN